MALALACHFVRVLAELVKAKARKRTRARTKRFLAGNSRGATLLAIVLALPVTRYITENIEKDKRSDGLGLRLRLGLGLGRAEPPPKKMKHRSGPK